MIQQTSKGRCKLKIRFLYLSQGKCSFSFCIFYKLGIFFPIYLKTSVFPLSYCSCVKLRQTKETDSVSSEENEVQNNNREKNIFVLLVILWRNPSHGKKLSSVFTNLTILKISLSEHDGPICPFASHFVTHSHLCKNGLTSVLG